MGYKTGLPALFLTLFSSATAFVPNAIGGRASSLMMSSSSTESKSDLESLANKLNPVINFYDPLNLAEADFWGQGNEATIGFLRHAEIKHGRVAMAAFVGYCVQSNYHFPWAQTLAGGMHPPVEIGPEAQWDATPMNAKLQILGVIGALELWDKCGGGGEAVHYMRGRKPGKYPTFTVFRDSVHFVLDVYDPFGFNKKMSEETKERRLVAEINNGRLAMLGIFGFLSADQVPGSVPSLSNIAIPYDGDIMAPLKSDFSFFSSAVSDAM